MHHNEKKKKQFYFILQIILLEFIKTLGAVVNIGENAHQIAI